MVFGPLQRDCARKTVVQRVGWGCRLEGEDALGVGGGVAGPIWKCQELSKQTELSRQTMCWAGKPGVAMATGPDADAVGLSRLWLGFF